MTGVTICRLGADGDCRRSSHGVLAQARPSPSPSHSIPAQFPGRVPPRPSRPNCSLTSSAPLLFFFSLAALSPPPCYLPVHILASFLLLRYCHYHSCPGHILSLPLPLPPSSLLFSLLISLSNRPVLSLPSFLHHLSILPLQAEVPPLP